MADEPAQAPPPPGGKSRMMPVAIVTLLMLGEGAGVYFLASAMNSSPETAVAGETAPGADKRGGSDVPGQDQLAEIELVDCRPSNKMSGKFISFQIRVSVLVPAAEMERAQQLAEAKVARLRDRTNFVIRSAELKHLNEPGLETIKRRLKHEYDSVFDDSTLVQEVLIPELLQSNAGV